VRWRRVDLQRLIKERFGVAYHERYVGTLLKELGFSHISARPHHLGQDGEIVEAYKKTSRARRARTSPTCPKAGKSRSGSRTKPASGRRNGIVRQWAMRGTRPRQPADQRYKSAYLIGAICPARGIGAGLALPFADTEAMQLHLDEISRHVARRARAVLLLDARDGTRPQSSTFQGT
jgi:hypothetical protein